MSVKVREMIPLLSLQYNKAFQTKYTVVVFKYIRLALSISLWITGSPWNDKGMYLYSKIQASAKRERNGIVAL